MTPIYADLHTHSTASDGVLAPSDFVRAARQAGLAVVALTDHDTVKGLPEALSAAAAEGIDLIPGIELSCSWTDSDTSLHVIGLFFDPAAPGLVNTLDNLQKNRYSRAFRILDKLEALNIGVSPLRQQFMEDTKQVLGRPHIARYLLETGVVRDFQEAFERFLKRGAPAHVAKTHLPPEAGIRLIKEAGGLAFIAHPGLTQNWDEVWKRINDLPWDGIEVYSPGHTLSQTEYFRKLADSRHLLVSGGSDFHDGIGKPANGLGMYGLNRQEFEIMQAAADRLRTPNLKVAAG